MLVPFILSSVHAAQLEFIDGKCKHTPVPNYISQTSLFDFQGEFPSAAEVQKANEKAIRRLVLPKCAGLSEAACFALQGKTSVVDYIINEDIKQICSLTMLSAQYVSNPIGKKELTSKEYLDKIAKQISVDLQNKLLGSNMLKASSIWVQNPILEETECSAGMMGKSIKSLVKDKLLEIEIPLSMHSSFEEPSIGIQFTIGDPWSVDVFFEDINGKTSLISHFEIPSRYMPASSQVCLEANSMGLENIKPDPSLRFEIDLDKNVFCEGDIIHPIIKSSVSSQMVVFSLMSDGNAYLIWPSVGTPHSISTELDLGEFEAVPSFDSGEERLVVVGILEKEKFGMFQEMNSFCKINDWQKYVPKKASIKTLSYQILPSGVGGCSYDSLDAKKRFNYSRTLERVPECK